MQITSPKPVMPYAAAKADSSNNLIGWKPTPISSRGKPPNWSFLIGLSAMLLLSAIFWAGFAGAIMGWFH